MRPRWQSPILFAMMLTASALALALRPSQLIAALGPALDLEAMIPRAFPGWREEQKLAGQIVDPQQQEALDEAYSQVLSRSYVDAEGYRIMLSIAYGKTQRGNLQLHHPELCYPGQGFAIHSNRVGQLATPYGAIPVRRLETQLNLERSEPVTYWAIVGNQVVLNSVARKLVELRYGVTGKIADGLLFRVSSIGTDSNAAFDKQTLFVTSLLGALSAEDRLRISGI
jgi:EpsI family protein